MIDRLGMQARRHTTIRVMFTGIEPRHGNFGKAIITGWKIV